MAARWGTMRHQSISRHEEARGWLGRARAEREPGPGEDFPDDPPTFEQDLGVLSRAALVCPLDHDKAA